MVRQTKAVCEADVSSSAFGLGRGRSCGAVGNLMMGHEFEAEASQALSLRYAAAASGVRGHV